MTNTHVPVLLHEAIESLQIKPQAWYGDGTFGRGGHTRAILSQGGKVIAFDCDAAAIAFGEEQFATEIEQGQLILIRKNFDQLKTAVEALQTEGKVTEVQGFLFDFGTSSPQLDDPTRGFSFQHNVELDMRMDDRLGVKARDLLAVLSEKQLSDIFYTYGGEREGRKIAKAIVSNRTAHPITHVQDLLELIEDTKKERRGHLHPATKVFQALRIAVNSELDSIEQALPQALTVIAPGARIVTISFHEGEDRIVKTLFRSWEQKQKGINITKNVVVPTTDETDINNRARSAKMRVFEKKL
jgi:16S rRNA (cytosine1402-N4)-methyltransferase